MKNRYFDPYDWRWESTLKVMAEIFSKKWKYSIPLILRKYFALVFVEIQISNAFYTAFTYPTLSVPSFTHGIHTLSMVLILQRNGVLVVLKTKYLAKATYK